MSALRVNYTVDSTINTFVLTLLEATVSLYPANADGSANTGSPIWSGVAAQALAVREKWVKVQTRPTGSLQPRNHPLVAQYEILLGRVWGFLLTDTAGFVTLPQRYVLDVVWVDEDTGNWHRETFYNVTVSERSRTSKDVDGGFTDEQAFDAEYMTPPAGGTGVVPVISGVLQYSVVWVGPDGTLPLYSYDPGSYNFTAVNDVSNRAQIVVKAGTFSISFGAAATDNPVLETTATGQGVALHGGLVQGAPDISVVPRLDFFFGALRVASVDANGNLYAFAFGDGAPAAGAGQFQIYAQSTLALTLGAAGAVANYWDETVI
jgi:hypothetical protein